MDKKNFGYSLKNIPIPNQNSYIKCLISKVDNLIRRMRWKAFFFERQNENPETEFINNNYGFNSEKTPPQNNALVPFENDLNDLINTIEFTEHRTNFQNPLAKDAKEIRSSPDLLVPADKTTNVYKVPTDSYKKIAPR